MSRLTNNSCLCGWAYRGKKCRELMRKHPGLKDGVWHYPIFAEKQEGGIDAHG